MKDDMMLRQIEFRQAINAYRKSDSSRWVSALWCSRIVGNYERGATLGLASDMGVSVDTIEWMAHAYILFKDLAKLDGKRLYVFAARRSGYVYLSHFRALYNARERYDLSNEETFELLVDIVQAEGDISSRDVDVHVQNKWGKERNWQYYAQRAVKELDKVIQHPQCPADGRRILQEAYSYLGDNA